MPQQQNDEFAQFARPATTAPPADEFSQFARPVSAPAAPSPTDALSKTTGIGPGPGPVRQAWEQFKGGFGAGGMSSGLPKQPTTAGNVGQLARFLGETELMTGGAMGSAEVAGRVIPIASRASHALNEVAKVANPIAIDTSKAMQVADRAAYLGEHGHKVPQVITDFAKRAATGQPITFQEGRDFYSAATSLSSQEVQETKAIMKGQLGKFTGALHDALTEAADAVGQGKTYEKAIDEYHKAKTMWRAAAKAGKIAATSAAATAGATAGYEIYKAAK